MNSINDHKTDLSFNSSSVEENNIYPLSYKKRKIEEKTSLIAKASSLKNIKAQDLTGEMETRKFKRMVTNSEKAVIPSTPTKMVQVNLNAYQLGNSSNHLNKHLGFRKFYRSGRHRRLCLRGHRSV